MGKDKKSLQNKLGNEPTLKKKKGLSKFRKREISFGILTIVALFLLSISSTYAIFASTQKASNVNTFQAGVLRIDFNDTDDGLGNIINMNGTYPISDSEGMALDPYVFQITNTGTLSANYVVKIKDDEKEIEKDGCQEELLSNNYIKYSLDGAVSTFLSGVSDKDYEIITGVLEPKKSQTYSLRMWISDVAGNEALGKHYHGKIVVEGVNRTDTN